MLKIIVSVFAALSLAAGTAGADAQTESLNIGREAIDLDTGGALKQAAPEVPAVYGYTVLVNYNNPIPEGYLDTLELTDVENGYQLEKTAAAALKLMLKDARAAGLYPYIVSAFRTNYKQQTLYNNQVKRQIGYGKSKDKAADAARRVVAYPGTSEHEIGLAVDIVSAKYGGLDKKQENTAEAKWLMENCAEYGFILRYSSDKTDKTEIIYEPWHYRYVGKKAAKEMTELGFCLEEYTKWLNERLRREL